MCPSRRPSRAWCADAKNFTHASRPKASASRVQRKGAPMTPNKLPPREAAQAWSEASFDGEADAVSRAMRAQIVARMELRLEQTVAEVDTNRRRARTYA